MTCPCPLSVELKNARSGERYVVVNAMLQGLGALVRKEKNVDAFLSNRSRFLRSAEAAFLLPDPFLISVPDVPAGCLAGTLVGIFSF